MIPVSAVVVRNIKSAAYIRRCTAKYLSVKVTMLQTVVTCEHKLFRSITSGTGMLYLNRLMAVVLVSGLALPVLSAETNQAQVLSHQQVAQILVEDYPEADPMVLDHARRLLLGEPVKQWKNCLLQKTLDQARQSEHSTMSVLNKP